MTETDWPLVIPTDQDEQAISAGCFWLTIVTLVIAMLLFATIKSFYQ